MEEAKEGFMILTQEVLDNFYYSAIANRSPKNVFKLGLIAAYCHFSAEIGTPIEKRIDTTQDRIDCAATQGGV